MRNFHQTIASSLSERSGPYAKAPFAPEQKTVLSEAVDRQRRLATVIAQDIIPRLMQLHHEVLTPCAVKPMAVARSDVARLADLVLGPSVQAARDYVLRMKQRGFSQDVLFTQLLEPSARHLGKLWEDDACDFLDVTLGVARLQELLSVFDDTNVVLSAGMRRAITAATPGEQHRLGLAMVEKFLRAAGWDVRSEAASPLEAVVDAVRTEWFAVAGVTASCESRIDDLTAMIKTIREQSCNKSIGVMVGGPLFVKHPELVARVGADAAAVNAPSSVLLAQKLCGLTVSKQAQTSVLS